jgi:hypothetical protein
MQNAWAYLTYRDGGSSSRMANQAKLAAFRRGPIYHFGFRILRSPQEAIRIDNENGNTLWQDAMTLDTEQLQEFCTFKDLGPPPTGYKKIRVHFVFAVKHDGRHKARLVADGHLTDAPIDSVYSGVVSLRSLRIVIFLAELNLPGGGNPRESIHHRGHWFW